MAFPTILIRRTCIRRDFHVCVTRQEKTRENRITRKIRNERNPSDFRFACFSQLATVRCKTPRFFRSLQILRLRIYKYIHWVQRKSHPTKSYHDESLFGLIRFFQKIPRNCWNFRALYKSLSYINIDLNLYRRDFCKIGSFALTLLMAKFFDFQY